MRLTYASDRGSQVETWTESALVAAATIAPQTDIVRLSGATQIDNITPRINVPHLLALYSTSDIIILGNTGNISVSLAVGPNFLLMLFYSTLLNKWLPHSGATNP